MHFIACVLVTCFLVHECRHARSLLLLAAVKQRAEAGKPRCVRGSCKCKERHHRHGGHGAAHSGRRLRLEKCDLDSPSRHRGP